MKADGNVEITISNPSLFTQIALVVDRKGVREGISRLQKKWRGKKADLLTIYGELGGEIQKLLKANGLPITFHSAIEEAVLTGKITKFSRVSLVAIPHRVLQKLNENSQEILTGKEGYEYGMVMPPETTAKEVEESFRGLKQGIREKFGGGELEGVKQPVSDTINSISHRNWYWLHNGKEGLSYYKIALREVKGSMEARDYQETVKKGIKDYEKRLKSGG